MDNAQDYYLRHAVRQKIWIKKIQIIFDFIESRSSYGGVPYLFNYKSYSYACVQLHAQHALTIFSNQLYI